MTMDLLLQDDPETKSADLIEENIQALQALFPEAFAEGRLDFDVLKQLLGGRVDEREEKYGLNWHGKRRARQLALTPSTGTLLPCPEDSVNWEGTKNLMIEGDNLEVLKLLQKSYAGKVKLIYIDPPYNTGKDFVYPDDFRDGVENYLELTGQINGEGRRASSNTESSGRFHTQWLNMLLPRLKMARSFLRKDGIIMISIDDHEINNLRQICDEIFGSENFVANFIWEKSRKNDAKLVSVGHEYIVVYALSLGYLKEKKIKWREEKPGARDIWEKYLVLRTLYGSDDGAIEKELQRWFSELPKTHPSKKWSRYKHIDRHGPWRDDNISWPGGGGPKYDVIHPETKLPCAVPERGWVFSKPESMKKMIEIGVVEFRSDHSEPPIRKSHIRPIDFEIISNDHEFVDLEQGGGIGLDGQEDLATQVRGSYFYKQSQVTAKYMRNLMGSNVFDNPKDHEELARLIDYTTAGEKDALVMDFFAGSGTIGQSVFSLNAGDGGNRRFILVQIPEKLDPQKKDQKEAAEFCKDIGKPFDLSELAKERLRRSADEVREESPEYEGDLGFRVYKLASSNIRAWQPVDGDLESTLFDHAEHLVAGRDEQDVLTELLLKLGLDLCVPIETQSIAGKTVHAIGGGALLVCLADGVDQDVVEDLGTGIVTWHEELSPAVDSRVVFKDSGFGDDVAKTNMTAIMNQHGITDLRSL